MALYQIQGSTDITFTASAKVINAGQDDINDLVFTIDLRPSNPKINVRDTLDYPSMGWDINDVVANVILIGPEGAIYTNEDIGDPDIVSATSRYLNKTINLPLDPLTDYTNILKGNYTLKVVWYNSELDKYHTYFKTYNYDFDIPEIENETVSGPYSGVLKSTDTTEYGDYYSIIRQHRIKYPTQLDPAQADIVSSNTEVEVTPIYTNKWEIEIFSTVEYRNSDLLRILWEGEGSFEHCVYGGCISAMYDAIQNTLDSYYNDYDSNVNNQEWYQKRLLTLNTAWHLLNVAYQSGDVEEADKQAYVIQKQVEYTGHGECEGETSEEVIPCPAYSGGGTGGEYTFSNGLTEAGGDVVLGGALTQNTNINVATYQFGVIGTGSGNTLSALFTVAGGILLHSNDGTIEGQVEITDTGVLLSRTDLETAANTRSYQITESGLVEVDDYTAYYDDRTLVSKEYVDSAIDDLNFIEYSFLNGLYTVGGDQVLFGGALIQDTYLNLTNFSLSFLGSGVDSYTSAVFSLQNGVKFYSNDDLIRGIINITDTGVLLSRTDLVTSANTRSYQITENGLVEVDDYTAYYDDRTLVSKSFVVDYIDSLAFATSFLELSDTPSSYDTFANYFLQVDSEGTGIQFVSGSWIPVTGGTFTGQIKIQTSNDYPLVLRQTGAGSVPSVAEPGTNMILFQDNDGDTQGYIGIDNSGNITLHTSISGGVIATDNNMSIDGDIVITGTVDGIDISDFYDEFDGHEHDWADITSGIPDFVRADNDYFDTQFAEKASAVVDDRMLIEDSADNYLKKWVSIGNLPVSATTFISMSDTPSTFSGANGYGVFVNATADALEFVDVNGMWIETADGTLNSLTEKVSPTASDILIIEDAADSYEQKKILIGNLNVAGASGYNVATQNVTLVALTEYVITTSLRPYMAQFYLNSGGKANVSIKIEPNGGDWDITLRSTVGLEGQLVYLVSGSGSVNTLTVDITNGLNSHNLLTKIEPKLIQIYNSAGELLTGITPKKTQNINWYLTFYSANPSTISNAVIVWINE